eukprot:sb/3470600/
MIEDTNKTDQHGLTAKMDYGGNHQGYFDGLNDLDSLDMHDDSREDRDNITAEIVHPPPEEILRIDEEYYERYKEIQERIRVRMERIEKVCRSLMVKHKPFFEIYQFNEIGASWCPVFKAGSTTWKYYFLDRFKPDHRTRNLAELGSRRLTMGNKRDANRFSSSLQPGCKLLRCSRTICGYWVNRHGLVSMGKYPPIHHDAK